MTDTTVTSAPAGFFQIGQINNGTVQDLVSSVDNAVSLVSQVSASATAAATSATAASTSATNAANSLASILSDVTVTAGSATAAAASATAASTSAGTAGTSATAAASSATAAGTSASTAAGSASTASTAATNAGNSANAASTSATAAATSASAASATLTSVNTSASNAATSASAAATSVTSAAGSASAAATSATNAAASLGTLMAASPLSTTTATPQTITSQVTHNGLLAATGGLTFTGGTLVPGSVYSDSNYGAIVMGHSGTVADVALRSHGGTIGVQMDTSGNVTLPVSLTVGSPTITLSGTQVPSQIAIIAQNYAGTTTASGTLNNLVIGSASDTLTAPNAYLVDLAVNHNVGAGWDGSRGGVQVQLNQVAASTSTLPLGAGLVGMTSNVVSNFNAGGVSTGFGTTAFGKGQLFGMTLRPVLEGGATYFTGCTGLEIDNECDAGSSVASNVGMQIVHEGPHAVQGTVADIAFRFGDQPAALVGWKDLITAGVYASKRPVDANGYIFSVHSGFNYGSFPALAAGGVDLLQATFSGTREAGGGFAFRTSGPSGLGATAVDLNGVLKVGTGTLTAVSGGVTLDTPSYVFSAVASIVSGGANFTSGDLVLDGYGNLFAVTASAGVVSALTLKKTAEGRSAAPSGTINCKSVTRTGSSLGTGLQITETWVQAKTINIGTSVATAVNIGNASSTTTITGALAASNALTVTGQTTCNGGIAFSGGALTAGSIYTDTNFGCLIKTHGGTVADFCVETSGGTNALEISTAGVVSVLAGLVVTGGISMAAGSNLKNNGLAVVGARQTGWVAMTGTTDIATSFATSTVTLIQLAERVAAIQAAITTHGLIGT